jgi:hypothetical protein
VLLYAPTPSCQVTIPSADCLFVLQGWAIAAHCCAQAKDWPRHAACKANHMLYSKDVQDHGAAVLLVEEAAGAAKCHKQLTTGGSDSLTPAAEAQAVEMGAQLALLRAQAAELAKQREADRAEIAAALKQQLADIGRVNGRQSGCWLG